MSTVIDELRHRRRKKSFEKWIFRAVLAEAFFIALPNAALASVALVGGIILLAMRFYMIREIEFVGLPYDVPAALFVIISAISVFVSADTSFSFYNWYNLVGVYGLTYLLVGQGVSDVGQVKKIVLALAAGATVTILYGFVQCIFGVADVTQEMRWVDGEMFPGIKERIYSTWENPNILAGYLDMIIMVAFGFFITAKNNRVKKIVLALFMLGALLCLVFTYSRGAMLSLFVVLAVYGLLRDWRILAVIALVGAVFFSVDSALWERFANLSADDSSSALRFALWESTIAMIFDHPFLGIGWGSYFIVYPEYDFFVKNPAVTIYHAHNIYLNYAAEIGIAGMFAFCWFLFGTTKLALGNMKSTELRVDLEKFDKKIFTSVVDKLMPQNEPEKFEAYEEKLDGILYKLTEPSTSVAENRIDKDQKDGEQAQTEPPTTVAKSRDWQTDEKKIAREEETAVSVSTNQIETAMTVVTEPKADSGNKKIDADGEHSRGEGEPSDEATKVADAEAAEEKEMPDDNSLREMTLSEAVAAAEAITRAYDQEHAKEKQAQASDKQAEYKQTDKAELKAADEGEDVVKAEENRSKNIGGDSSETDDGESKDFADKADRLPIVSDNETTDDGAVESQPLSWRDALDWNDEHIVRGLTAGIGLAFVSVAVNGITDDLLFNISTSMLVWFLAALAAVMHVYDMAEESANEQSVERADDTF